MNGKPAGNVVLHRKTEVTRARMVTNIAFSLEPVGPLLTVLVAPHLKELIRTACDSIVEDHGLNSE